MKKFIAVAALMTSLVAVPVLPVHAAPMTSAQKDCLIFPMFKKQCWEMGAKQAAAAPKKVALTVENTAEDAKLPVLWHCTAAPKGSGHLLDC